MGMDVFGSKPKTPEGKYFRANVWYWHPLWSFVELAHPVLAAKVPDAHSNSGDGLNGRDSLALAQLLKKDLEKGLVDEYINQFNDHKKSIPLKDCPYCDSTGKRSWPQEDGSLLEKVCNSCNGTLKVQSIDHWYHVDKDLFIEFQNFLQNCGGFQIC
jgi:hypothetical protein